MSDSHRQVMSCDKRFRILFVDDDRSVLDGIGRTLYLKRDQWELAFAGSALEAIDQFHARPFNVIVSDMRMPGMSGAELLREIHALCPDCIRIMLTGHADMEITLAAINDGHVFLFLLKPCDGERLRECLELAKRQFDLQTVERELLSAKLEHSQKMSTVGQFTAGIVHDLNNILFGISGLSGKELSFDREDALASINEAANRAHELTRELMSFSRREEEAAREPVDLSEAVESSAKLLRVMLGQRVTLRTQVTSDLRPIWGHSGKIKQIITNLAINARDAMASGGSLTISTRACSNGEGAASATETGETTQRVCLTVSDSGCGMDLATQARIFEPFFTTKGSGKGTGIGLSMVQLLVKQHRGWIEVESLVGKGSTFNIYFPVDGDGLRMSPAS